MKILIYGRQLSQVEPISELLESFDDIELYELVVEDKNEGTISDIIDCVGAGKNGIEGVVFVGICPPEELMSAIKAGIEILLLFTCFDSVITMKKIQIGQATSPFDENLNNELDNFVFRIKEKTKTKLIAL